VKRILAIAVCLLAAAPAAQAIEWKGEPTGIFRTGRYDSGEWIYTNGIQQARGANSDGLHRTDYFKATDPHGDDPTHINRDIYNAVTYDAFGSHRAAHNGDYQLPTDDSKFPVGTADLAELRLAIRGGDLYVRLLWNSFPRPDAQIATLTFGDGPAHPWPRNARLSSPWQKALTVWGSGAALADATGGEQQIAVTTGDHVTEARVPLAALPEGKWTLRGGSGLADGGRYTEVPAGQASSTQPGSGGPASPTNVWDLLFADDAKWTFDELRQSDDLAKADATTDKVDVDPARLRLGASTARTKRTPDPAAFRTGDITRLFASRWSGGDGLKRYLGLDASGSPPPPGAPTQGFMETWQWSGRLQPYAMHVPDRYAKSKTRWPLIVYLHGFANSYDEAFYEPAGLVDEADRQGYLLAAPLERGDYFYRDQGDMDVLEVIQDVERHYNVDRSRIYLIGHSMGGYGTNNVSTHHPDLFAAVAPAEGTDSIELAANLRNVPWFETSAEEDLDAGAQDAKKMYGELSDRGFEATLLVYDFKIHEYSSIYDHLPDLFRFFARNTLERNPAIVSFVRPAGQDRPELGLVYDHAYWLSDITAADAKTNATVTVTSSAIRHVDPDPARAERTTEVVFDPDAPTKRSIGELYSTTPGGGPYLPRANALSITATNLSAVTVDAERARLRLRRLRVQSNSDKPYILVLRAGRTTKRVAVPAGEQTLRL
jgi:pimeloyl-ACP methyl ester carboxylesterase